MRLIPTPSEYDQRVIRYSKALNEAVKKAFDELCQFSPWLPYVRLGVASRFRHLPRFSLSGTGRLDLSTVASIGDFPEGPEHGTFGLETRGVNIRFSEESFLSDDPKAYWKNHAGMESMTPGKLARSAFHGLTVEVTKYFHRLPQLASLDPYSAWRNEERALLREVGPVVELAFLHSGGWLNLSEGTRIPPIECWLQESGLGDVPTYKARHIFGGYLVNDPEVCDAAQMAKFMAEYEKVSCRPDYSKP